MNNNDTIGRKVEPLDFVNSIIDTCTGLQQIGTIEAKTLAKTLDSFGERYWNENNLSDLAEVAMSKAGQ